MRFSRLLIALLCGLGGLGARAGHADASAIVAVFNIDVQDAPFTPRVAERLTEYLTTQLAATGRYRVVPRGQIKRRLSRQKRRSYRNCYARACQIELGKELAAQKSLSCRLMRIGRACVLTANLYDLRSTAAEAAASARGACKQEAVLGLIDSVVARLAGGGSGTAPAASDSTPQIRSGKGGSAYQRQIQAAIVAAMPRIQHCYEQGLALMGGLSGKVVVDFTIARTGHVSAARVQSTTLTFPTVESCITGVVRRLRIAPTPDGKPVKVRYPFVLRVAGQGQRRAPSLASVPSSTPPWAFRARPRALSRREIQAGMREIGRHVQACYDRYGAPGLATVRTTIGDNGTVRAARVVGVFAGTPTGNCVAAAVRRARFPRFDGEPLQISYPFVLR